MKKIATTVLLSALIAAPAVAGGFYGGVKTGWARHSFSTSGYAESDTAFGVLGGYMITPYIAVEAEYIDLGSIVAKQAKITALSVNAVLYWPIEDELALFVKLGAANTQEKFLGSTSNRSSPTLGLGGQFILNEIVDLRFALDRYSYGGDQGFYKATVNLYSAGAVFRF